MQRLITITKNKLCTELALFTRIYRDALSTKRKKKHTDDLTVFMKLFVCKRYL